MHFLEKEGSKSNRIELSLFEGVAIGERALDFFTTGVSVNSKAPDAALDLIKFLTEPTAIPVIKWQGTEPQ